MRICIVPDICGSPPSTAVNTREICSCFSLSKGFSSTISTFLCPSGLLCSFRPKFSVGFSSYFWRSLIPTSRSTARSRSNFAPVAADSLILKFISLFSKVGALSLMSVIWTVTV
uniref:Uncharacterized protein n=1 Tax=Neolamprologus brichardi TaxID=32507 RepID=A0A3Q4G7K2_NEOBR